MALQQQMNQSDKRNFYDDDGILIESAIDRQVSAVVWEYYTKLMLFVDLCKVENTQKNKIAAKQTELTKNEREMNIEQH